MLLEDLLIRKQTKSELIKGKGKKDTERDFGRMSSSLWVTINGSRYPIKRSEEPRKLLPGGWGIEKETFVHSGCEWETVKGITLGEAIRIRDLNRKLKHEKAGTGECVDIDDDGRALIWCKETNFLCEKMEVDETLARLSLTGEISDHYSEKLHAVCVGKMVLDGDQWVPEDKASWNRTCDSSDEESDDD